MVVYRLEDGLPFSVKKQKLNTRSSTETEILAVDYCMPAVLWTRYWLNAQEYDVFNSIVYQGSESGIILENNRRASSRKCKNHINIR